MITRSQIFLFEGAGGVSSHASVFLADIPGRLYHSPVRGVNSQNFEWERQPFVPVYVHIQER